MVSVLAPFTSRYRGNLKKKKITRIWVFKVRARTRNVLQVGVVFIQNVRSSVLADTGFPKIGRDLFSLTTWGPCLAVDHSSRLPHAYQLTRKNGPTISRRCEFWRFRRGVTEYAVLLGYDAVSVGNRIRRSETCRPVKISAVLSVETSGSNYPLTQRPILKQRNLHFSSFHLTLN